MNHHALSAAHLGALRAVVKASAQAPASFTGVREAAGFGPQSLATLLADLEGWALVQHSAEGYSPTIGGRRALEGAA